MSKQTIYRTLINAGMTPQGACGLMGNFQAESGMRADNVQDGMTSLSDEAYTNMVDNGEYQNFVRDGCGYGLYQLTYWKRKENFLAFAKSKGKSIGDEQTQVEFCIKEMLTEYLSLWNYLCTTNDLYTATSRVCTEFERPAVNNISVRYNFAQQLYKELSAMIPMQDELEEIEAINQSSTSQVQTESNRLRGKLSNETVWHIQGILASYGYDYGKADGLIGDKTKAALKQFTADFGEI